MAPSTIEMWNPQNFTPKVSRPPKYCPMAGQGMSEPCAVIGYLFPSLHVKDSQQLQLTLCKLKLLTVFHVERRERQSATSVNSLQTAMISRLPLSSYYLIPHGVILQLYDILGQLPLQSLLLAVIIFNLLETTHFSTGWQKKASRGGGRGKKKKEKLGCEYIQLEKLKCWFSKFVLPCFFYFDRLYSTFCFWPGLGVKELLESIIFMHPGQSKSKIIPQI